MVSADLYYTMQKIRTIEFMILCFSNINTPTVVEGIKYRFRALLNSLKCIY